MAKVAGIYNTQEEFNKDAIKYLKVLIEGLENEKINANNIDNEVEYVEICDPQSGLVLRMEPTDYYKLCLRYKKL